MNIKITCRVVLSGLLLALAGCATNTDPAAGPPRAHAVVKTYAASSYAQYGDAVIGAEQLQAAIDDFLDAPSATTLAHARTIWTQARRSYMPTEARRGWDGPIDHANTGPGDALPDGPEVSINSWPLDESYLDYTMGPSSTVVLGGLVYDDTTMPTITADALRDANGLGGDGNISTGYHAIEFLLWGQDLDPHGPGARPYTDYVIGGTVQREIPSRYEASLWKRMASTDAVLRAVDADGAVERRRAMLGALTGMLVDDLRAVRDAWAPGSAWYQSWVNQPVKDGLTKILAGVSFLAKDELTNARIQTAFDLAEQPDVIAIDPGPGGSQEEEHSCFSDTTHLDIYDDVRAMETALTGVWNSPYGATNDRPAGKVGKQNVLDLVAAVNPSAAAHLRHDLDSALAVTRAMRDAGEAGETFDRQILHINPTGRARVQHALDALNALAVTLDGTSAALGLTVTFVPDDD